MIKMNLTSCEKIIMLAIDKGECERLLPLICSGEELCYEYNGGLISICNGVLSFSNIETIPVMFGILAEDGYRERQKNYTLALKRKIKKVVIGDGAKIICYDAFEGFSNLTEIVIPDGIEKIISPFSGCDKLKPYSLPSSIKYISGSIFGRYPNHVILPDGLEELNGAFYETDIESVVIPGSVKIIDSKCFYGCKKLKSVKLTEGIKEIHSQAFALCTSLENVEFPNTLEYIGSSAFAYCDKLKLTSFPDSTEINRTAFQKTPFDEFIRARSIDLQEHLSYDGPIENIECLEELKAVLNGKPFSEQSKYFRLLSDSSEADYSYGNLDSSKNLSNARSLTQCSEIDRLVVYDGVIVGVEIYGKTVPVGKCICVYYASEDDGVGTRSVEEYRTLVFDKNLI